MSEETPAPPKPPRGLKTAGRRLWNDIIAKWELRPDELRVLAKACQLEDNVVRLQKGLEEAPLTSEGSMGQEVIHPLFQEIRQQMTSQASLLRQLKLEEAAEEAESRPEGPMSRTESAKKAANARWQKRKGA